MMKKLLSVMLAVVMLFSLTAMSVSAAETTSLLNDDVAAWVCKDAGEGSITITKEDDALVFSATKGWPEASYTRDTDLIVLPQAGQYLNYDFTVEGQANIMIFFNGQNPTEQGELGADGKHFANYQSINPFVAESIEDNPSAQEDLPAGTYKGSLELTNFVNQGTEDGNVQVSGIKVFAVGENAKVTIREMSVGDQTSEEVKPTTSDTPATTAADNNAAANTTAAANGTSAKTGEESNALLFVAVAAMAVAVAGVSAVAAKKAKSK